MYLIASTHIQHPKRQEAKVPSTLLLSESGLHSFQNTRSTQFRMLTLQLTHQKPYQAPKTAFIVEETLDKY